MRRAKPLSVFSPLIKSRFEPQRSVRWENNIMTERIGEHYSGAERQRVEPVEVGGRSFEITSNLYDGEWVVVQRLVPDGSDDWAEFYENKVASILESAALQKLGFRLHGCDNGMCLWKVSE